jgi:hypothetical protein
MYRYKKIHFYFLLIILSLFFLDGRAEAIPAFSKKYSAPCSLCHSSWPRLNRVGFQFKVNGYQLPGDHDGSTAGKSSPAWNLFLDSGDANPPISFRLRGGWRLIQPRNDFGGEQANNAYCCTEATTVGLYAGGTIREDVGYFVSAPLVTENGGAKLDQGYIRIVNMFGDGLIGLDLGTFRTSDFDLVPPNREWFGSPNTAYFGNESFRGRAQGMAPGFSDTGIRLYGNPGYGIFSYSVAYVTGGRSTNTRFRGRGKALTVMGRVETDHWGLSVRFWNNKSSSLTFQQFGNSVIYDFNGENGATSTTNTFNPSPDAEDEETTDIVLNLKYEIAKWQIEYVFDDNRFNFTGRTNSAGNKYTRNVSSRNGMSLDVIYRMNAKMAFGARWGYSKTDSFSEAVNGVSNTVPEAKVSRLDLQFEFLPVENARLALQITLDASEDNARQRVLNNSIANFDQQNKLVLLWDWAI